MNINTLARQLKTARNEAARQTKAADDIARELVMHMREYLKQTGTTLQQLSERSGYSKPQLVNWLYTEFAHRLPPDGVMVIWNAIAPVKGQRVSFVKLMAALTPADWQTKTYQEIARQVGCSRDHAREFHAKLKKKQVTNTLQK